MPYGNPHNKGEDAEETVFDVSMHRQQPQPPSYNGKNTPLMTETFVTSDPEEGIAMNGHHHHHIDPADIPYEDRCGIACCKPNWLQKLRNMKVFLLVFIITGLTQGMYYSYWNMSLSSIEKRFQIPSRTTGIITAINDVSHIAVVLLVAHFCGKGHRPRWLAVSSLLLGIAILTFATPELFAPKWDAENIRMDNSSIDKEICLNEAQAQETADKCDAESQAIRNDNMWALILLGVAQVLLGIATTAPIVLAMPFIDDNVETKNTAVYFALGLAGRLIGPLIGVFVGSFSLSTYVDLTKKPNIAQTDPRWMGAWYLGFVLIGSLVCLTSTLYWFFPRHLSNEYLVKHGKRKISRVSATSQQEQSLSQKLAVLPRDMKRLLVNKVFMCRLINDCIDMLVVSGYFNFSSKYIEFHFRMSPAQAGKASGLSSILAMGLGAAVGGLIVRRFKMTPKQIAIGLAISSFLISICYFFLMLIRCEPRNLHSIPGPDEMLIVDTMCSNGCNCAGKSFSPVCDELTQTNYYSPCHAGCTATVTRGMGQKFYENCQCLLNITAPQWIQPASPTPTSLWTRLTTTLEDLVNGPPADVKYPGATVKRGFCEGGCSGFWTYVAISASFKFIGMLPFSGNTMLSFRIVEPDLKALSKALQTFCASLFAFIPGPIIMGALIDSTCRLWNTQACGQRGACLIYDLDSLRYKMHLYVGVIKTLACIMDIYVIFKVKNLSFDREPEKRKEDEEKTELQASTVATIGSARDLTNYD
ncbi:solute carrier organic anion transporter family member 74D-like [Paramacrobiotus metropolitanus]|uniref:solute carrier organic anion transporter family member 74D-like n=1 Tax=Paramacrobiotus metropolitanus TaxID=2943436 RepID=UPI0024456F75|nr:solute carrier organic anion transporter family member 74D-like [Paramacrobiotus metropolitanus]